MNREHLSNGGYSMKTKTEAENTPTIKDELRLSLMGSEGSGKTCFFAGLAFLGSATRKSEFVLIGRNEPSQAFINDLKATLSKNELPQSTHKSDALALDIICKGARIGIDIEDFAGEEFRMVGTDLKTDSPFFAKLAASRYLLLFLDIENDVDREASSNAERLDAVLNLLAHESLCNGKRKLAVVLTKSDVHGFTDKNATSVAASAYLKDKKPSLFKKIEGLGYKKEFFFLAPIGRPSLADGQPPKPFGYDGLFAWLVDDLIRERFLRFIRRWWLPLTVGASIILLSVGICAFMYIDCKIADWILTDPSASIREKETALVRASQKVKDDYIDAEIDRINKEITTIDTLDDLAKTQRHLERLGGHGSSQVEERLMNLNRAAQEKREERHIERIENLIKNEDLTCARGAISDYHLDSNASKLLTDRVSSLKKSVGDAEKNLLRETIRANPVVSGDTNTLKTRCDCIEKFPFPSEAEKKEALRAVDIARLFLADAPYHIEIKSAKGILKSSRTRLELSNLGPKSTVQQEETTHLDSRNPQWNKTVEFRWKPGDRIKVEWLWQAAPFLASTAIGVKEFPDPWTSLLSILGGVELEPVTGAFHAFHDGIPSVSITCKEFPDPVKDAELFRKYVAPGTYWND